MCWLMRGGGSLKMSDLMVKVKEKRDTTSNALNKSFCCTLTLSTFFLMEEKIVMCIHLASWDCVERIGIFCFKRAGYSLT